MHVKFTFDDEIIKDCLNQAEGTYEQLLCDLYLEPTEEDKKLFENTTVREHIKEISIGDLINLGVKQLHPSTYDEDNNLSFVGIIVVINDLYILDGNHRFNTLCSLIKDGKANKEQKVPVLRLYVNRDDLI